MDQQLRAAQQQKLSETSNDNRVSINSGPAIAAATMFASTSANTSMTNTATIFTIAAAHTNTLTKTITTMTMLTRTVKEATFTTDWISQGMCHAPNVSKFIMIVTLHLRALVAQV